MAWSHKEKPVQPNIAEQARMAMEHWMHRIAFYKRRAAQASQPRRKSNQSLTAAHRSLCSKK